MIKPPFSEAALQGVPIIGCKCAVCSSHDRHDKRLRSSLLVSQNGTTVVIDAGPDFRYQMLRENADTEVGKAAGEQITSLHTRRNAH